MSFDFYLGSASPRRKELLQKMGLKFSVLAADVDETRRPDEPAEDYVVRVAIDKALAVEKRVKQADLPNKAIITADTSVVLNELVFGKPRDFNDAVEMWQKLSDTKHQVLSSVVLLNDGNIEHCLSDTQVEFLPIDLQQMRVYWDSGEPQDKAGAYAIQGYASAWVKQISGSYTGVVGLPLLELNELLKRIDLNWL